MASQERDSWRFRQGDRITDDLTAMRLLGGGSSYEAFLCFDEVTFCPVVVKVLRPGRVSDESSLRGLRREAEALRVLNHPVTVRGLRHDESGDRPHLVIEHVDGPRLSTLIRQTGPLQPQQYLPLAIDTAAALHYFGRLGWVHLDIKPSNVIMGSPARLIDMSVARTVDAARKLQTPIGTDAYMSPEQCAPGRHAVPDLASDVWGLGATLYESVTGGRPFEAGATDSPDLEERYPQLSSPPRPLPDWTPPEVAAVITGSLSPTPTDRPAPADIVDALEPVVTRQPVPKIGGLKVHR